MMDIKWRYISNKLVLLVFLISWSLFDSSSEISYYIASGVFFSFLYAANIIAGGDLKLILAFLPGVNTEYMLSTICLMGILGGCVALLCFLYGFSKKDWLETHGLPYGVAIVSGFLVGSAASL
ncbi:hypothetical protein GT360_20190 [Vibrio astriarenae]|uniref:Prepilin type IV endopeptidase peptidase domain-containing protein n=2 Tax=Vibrio astriarenae TaxID=1481923 RepID=A0A7Z2T7S3_9VIBR|nr:prepilin peptidase [Vibrio astriarenae]QIA65835.1 hypothetical protein GT360_20190 [Vibrio astriarenae]